MRWCSPKSSVHLTLMLVAPSLSHPPDGGEILPGVASLSIYVVVTCIVAAKINAGSSRANTQMQDKTNKNITSKNALVLSRGRRRGNVVRTPRDAMCLTVEFVVISGQHSVTCVTVPTDKTEIRTVESMTNCNQILIWSPAIKLYLKGILKAN